MKKYLLSLAVLSVALFSACNEDNEKQQYEIPVSKGAYVVGSGNTGSGIPGNLTYYDYTTRKATPDAFGAANSGMKLGMTANDAMCYGEKFYIVVDGENTVFVTNAKTLKVIRKIDMTASAMLGTDGAHPRRITAEGDKIYVSSYGGYVAAIDTLNFSLVDKYKTGPYPEGICVVNGTLLVANSDYGNGNASISMIDTTTKTEKVLKHENIRNPQDIAVDGTGIYFLDYGQYGDAPTYAQKNAGVYRISGTDTDNFSVTKVIADATGMACAGTKIYTFNAPYAYGVTNPVTYSVYDTQTGMTSSVSPADIESPAAIGVDPLTGDLFIASYHMVTSEYGTYADYSSNGYVNVYDSSFNKKGTFDCGVGPQRIAFNFTTETIEY